jgi:hypothetical protein
MKDELDRAILYIKELHEKIATLEKQKTVYYSNNFL